MFNSVLGNSHIKRYLAQALQQNRLSHALLFSGMEGIGKKKMAYELAAMLLKTSVDRLYSANHPDFRFLAPEGKVGLHSIEMLRGLIDEVHAAPFEGEAKVFILDAAERMQPAAANAFLKTLEEPTEGTTFILLTSQLKEILPTILSRCVRLYFQPLLDEEVERWLKENGHPLQLVQMAQGSIGRALEFANRPEWEADVLHLLSKKASYLDWSKTLEKIEEQLDEVDPMARHQVVESILSAIFMWFRDQHVRRINNQAHLFFPSQAAVDFALLPLEKVQQKLESVRMAWSRNIKLSVSLLSAFV